MKNIIFRIFLFFGLFLAISCGTRKTQKTEFKEETKLEASASSGKIEEKQKETQTQTNTENKTETQNNIIDESEKDGIKTTTWENAKVNSQKKRDTSKKIEVSKESENSNISELSELSEYSEFDIKQLAKKAESGKITEADKGLGFSLWWLLFLLVPIGLWRLYKTRKNEQGS